MIGKLDWVEVALQITCEQGISRKRTDGRRCLWVDRGEAWWVGDYGGFVGCLPKGYWIWLLPRTKAGQRTEVTHPWIMGCTMVFKPHGSWVTQWYPNPMDPWVVWQYSNPWVMGCTMFLLPMTHGLYDTNRAKITSSDLHKHYLTSSNLCDHYLISPDLTQHNRANLTSLT